MDERTAKPSLIALGGFLALAAAMGVGRFVYTPILPFMSEALGLTKTEAGLIASANFLGYLLGALMAAGAFPRGDPRSWFVAALAASAATTAAMASTENVAAFAALRFAGGLASAFVMVFSSSLILERLAAAGRASLSGLHFAGVGAGIAASAGLVFTLGQTPQDWSVLWLAGGAFTLICLVLVLLLVPGKRTAAGPAVPGVTPVNDNAVTGPDRTLVRLIVSYGLFGFGYVITATFISTIVRETQAVAALEPLVWLTVGLVAIPSVVFWNRIAKRTGNGRAYALACIAQALGVTLSVLASSGLALLLAAALLGGTFMGLTALGLIEARRLSSAAPRRAIALMTASFGVGQMVGPLVAGLGFDLTGSFAAPSLLAAAALVVAAVLVVPRGT